MSGFKISNFIDPLFDSLKENCLLDEKKGCFLHTVTIIDIFLRTCLF